MNDNSIVRVAEAAGVLDRWTPDQVALIKRTCAGAAQPSDDEFSLFLAICKNTGLDPFLKEIMLVPRRAKVKGEWVESLQPLAGRDGYLSCAHRSGKFAGIEAKVFPEDPSKQPTHATCRVYRTDFVVPVEVTVAFAEYIQTKRDKETGRRVPNEMWATKPRTMIQKVAESQALRRAFNLHGTLTREEVQDEEDTAPPEALPPPHQGVARLKEQLRSKAEPPMEPLQKLASAHNVNVEVVYPDSITPKEADDNLIPVANQKVLDAMQPAPPPSPPRESVEALGKRIEEIATLKDQVKQAFYARQMPIDARKAFVAQHFGNRTASELSVEEWKQLGDLIEKLLPVPTGGKDAAAGERLPGEEG